MYRFSVITRAFGIYIIISASFMLQVRNFLMETFGQRNIKTAFIILFLALVLIYILYIYRKKLPIYIMGLSFSVFLLAYLIIIRLPYFAEKLHVIEYGVLGFLALRDHFEWDRKHADKPNFRRSGWLKKVVWSLFFVALVSWLDEAFQWVLPDRYFDWRDILTNVASGLLGIIQYQIYRHTNHVNLRG